MNDEAPQQRKTTALGRFSASGRLTPLLIALFCAILLAGAFEHVRGNFHRLQTAVGPAPPPSVPTGPGGQPPVRLSRSATAISSQPEFISATFLPGRGLQVLQITASIPGHGEVPLLFAPSLEDATRTLTGSGDDANGSRSTTFGGAFSVPWAGQFSGAPGSLPGTLGTMWNNQRLVVPAAAGNTAAGNVVSSEGLLLNRATDSIRTSVINDGQAVQAMFQGVKSPGWPGTFDVVTTIQLTGHALELSMSVRNTSNVAMPIGAGWHPYFAIPSGDRANAVLTLPSEAVLEMNRKTGLPTGKTTSIYGAANDFMRANGIKLGSTTLDETYTNLQSGVLADGPIAELRDPAFDFSLRLIPLTSNITSMRVVAPAGKSWISISPDTNVDDALGSEWTSSAESGLTMLEPGATFEWKARLEISRYTGP